MALAGPSVSIDVNDAIEGSFNAPKKASPAPVPKE